MTEPAPVTVHEPGADRAGRGPAHWIGLVLGGLLVLVGIRGALGALDVSEWRGLVTWLVGIDLAVDLVALPLAAVVGIVVVAPLPGWLRVPVRSGLFASVMVMIVAWAPLQSTASVTDNPTIQPLDYGTAVLTLLGVIWLVVALWAGARLSYGRRS